MLARARLQWHLTNDGTFDTQPAASPTTTHAYTALGTTNTLGLRS